ncbi:MAG: hypothetical protein JWO85_563 [Candidatus Eremiobacteraeota bacterium]|nr:hypothetical protein [Candidatus Eremiobacteraeota bacterium]
MDADTDKIDYLARPPMQRRPRIDAAALPTWGMKPVERYTRTLRDPE